MLPTEFRKTLLPGLRNAASSPGAIGRRTSAVARPFSDRHHFTNYLEKLRDFKSRDP
jgi:hypothetical protein